MSHRFKHKLAAAECDEALEQFAEIRDLSLQIESDEQIELLLDGATGKLRNEMLEHILPYLTFIPSEKTLACHTCGRHRGSIVPHECMPN